MIRTALENDAEQIAKIHVISWQHTYRGQMPDNMLTSLSIVERKQMWARIICEKPNSVLVYENKEKILGFVSSGPSRDSDLSSCTVGEIYAIYLLPEMLNSGLGHQLWVAAIESLHDAGFARALVWVLSSNEKARKFYEREGFIEDGVSKEVIFGDKPLTELRYVCNIGR